MTKIRVVLGVIAMLGFGVLFGGMGALAGEIPSIDAVTLESKLATKNPPLLLDVREPSETAQGIIKGAKLIPLGSLSSRLGELPKDQPIVIYCRSGNRSLRAAALLQAQGFTKVENLTGGMSAWSSKCATNKNYC